MVSQVLTGGIRVMPRTYLCRQVKFNPPRGANGAVGPSKASWALEDLVVVLLLHVRRDRPPRAEE